MSTPAISQMRIFELRSQLKDYGLSSSGTKQDLIARLTKYLEEHEGGKAAKEESEPIQQEKAAIPEGRVLRPICYV